MGAQGVGLLRTEFLLTGRAALPTEDEQTDYFRRVATAFPGHTVVIRSFDLGGDKFPAAFKAPAGGQSVPRLALDPGLPRPARDLPAPAPRHPPRRRRPRHPADAAAGDPGGGGARGAGDRAGGGARRSARAGIRAAESVPVGCHDRDAGGGADRRPAGRGQRLLQHRHQRPDPVHAGGGSRQRAARRPVHAAPSVDRPAAPPGAARSAARPASR